MQALETAPTDTSMKTSNLTSLIGIYGYVCFVSASNEGEYHIFTTAANMP